MTKIVRMRVMRGHNEVVMVPEWGCDHPLGGELTGMSMSAVKVFVFAESRFVCHLQDLGGVLEHIPIQTHQNWHFVANFIHWNSPLSFQIQLSSQKP